MRIKNAVRGLTIPVARNHGAQTWLTMPSLASFNTKAYKCRLLLTICNMMMVTASMFTSPIFMRPESSNIFRGCALKPNTNSHYVQIQIVILSWNIIM